MLYPSELRAQTPPELRYRFPTRQAGRGRGIRTPDTLLPKQVRYQAALYPEYASLAGDSTNPTAQGQS